MTIAVTTPTGNVGRHVVRALLRAGQRPRLLLRDPGRLPADVLAEVDAVQVDQGDEAAVLAATRGVDALYWVEPPTEVADPNAEYERVAAIGARAVAENGIGHVVFQSSVGAELRHGAGEIDALAATELAFEAVADSVVHLRCGFFFSNLLLNLDAVRAGTIPVILPVDAPMAWVASRDIAEVAAGWLLSREWRGRQVQAVHGPADLSWADAARIVSRGLGREVSVERIPDDRMRELLRGSGMGDGLVEAVMGMSVGLRDGFVPEQPRTVRTTTPTTLAEWVQAELVPALAV